MCKRDHRDVAPELPLGAHLVSARLGYEHHGIYAGAGLVIHYPGFKTLLRRGTVEEATLERFARGREVRVKDWAAPRFSGAARVERARSRLGEDRYRLFSNNCRHFAEWCVLGDEPAIVSTEISPAGLETAA
jgi:lecithin:retinol acyltransferase